ncbi:uracil-xanthine permease family protein [Halapricum hydrolyticum]|uniref:Solute carrier family 23 protein n=1 Tax=Halapricum hydrolyticum TaxID=2979991 RepID=A0AAE3I9V8_9EURY|nr:solute carrier family 23 protein [Halapricum hydrolyticum]MCU4717431.1 solute carrier family 23 protein [Halapricum hydrolyticum]MCU4726595.1 solute carrier family 23 protein [Halapricum hydrolyticum]
MGDSESDALVEYGIEDRPPLGRSILLGAQHYLTMIGANIAVPLLLASAMGMPTDVTAKFIGTFFVVSGIATLAQTTFGNRYPIVQGAPFSMLAPGLAIVTTEVAVSGLPAWNAKLLFLQGAIITAAIVEIAIGYFGLVGKIREYLSPVVVAPVVALIGLSLFSAPQVTQAANNWYLLLLTLGLIVLFSQYLDRRSPVFALFPVLLGIAAAWIIAAVASATGLIPAGDPGFIDFERVTDVESLLYVPLPFQWGMPMFKASFAVGMFAGVLASIIESFADYHAVARISGVGAPSKRRINHGIGMEGLANVFSGVMGTGGSTSYSENIGAIGLTGVASRFVVQVGAVVMLVVGVVPFFGQLIATIPDPIVGGLYVAMFGQIVAVGLANLKYVDLDSSRNLFIVGIALFAGMAIPQYIGGLEGYSALQTGLANVPLFGSILGTEVVARTVFIVGGVEMAVGGFIALVLDNTIPGTREERGLTDWARLAEDEGDFDSALDRARDRWSRESPPMSGDD